MDIRIRGNMVILEFDKQITTLDNRDVKVRIMTPDNYESNEKRYPVIYINDGQDVFRDEHILWGECSMNYEEYYKNFRMFMPDFIIVAIECPADRNTRTEQYSPFTKELQTVDSGQKQIFNGKGKEYLEWLVYELKPWVDDNFLTKAGPEFTGICGYSTGGLLAIYAALTYPKSFSRLIAMSSAVAIWMDELKDLLDSSPYGHFKYIYMDVGTNEFGRISSKEDFIQGAEKLYESYIAHGVPDEIIKYNVYPNAVHSQYEWKMRFPDALRWVFQDMA